MTILYALLVLLVAMLVTTIKSFYDPYLVFTCEYELLNTVLFTCEYELLNCF